MATPTINFTIRNQALAGGKFSGTLEVSGEDFSGNDYKGEKDFSIDAADGWDIPVAGGVCTVHVGVKLENPKRLCFEGHINCQGAQHNFDKITCFDF